MLLASNMENTNTTTLFSPKGRRVLGAIDVNQQPRTTPAKTKGTIPTPSKDTPVLPSRRPNPPKDASSLSKPTPVQGTRPRLSPKEQFNLVWRQKGGEWSRDDFLLGEQLGVGGVSIVYLATEKQSRYQVALKVQPASDDATSELELHQMLYHPNIVNVIDSFHGPNVYDADDDDEDEESCDEILYIILELCQQGSMNELVDIGDCGLPEEVAAKYFLQMVNAVDYIHQSDIIHCDIKPANFLVSHGQAKLADFGMAVSGVVREVVGGTVSYMAPEHLVAWYHDTYQFDQQVDVYSLGVVLFELLFGYLPYDVMQDDSSPLLDRLNDEQNSAEDLNRGMEKLGLEDGSEDDESDDEELPILDLRKILTHDPTKPFSVPAPIFVEDISEEARDLILRLMEPMPEKRISLKEAKKHKWFRRFRKSRI